MPYLFWVIKWINQWIFTFKSNPNWFLHFLYIYISFYKKITFFSNKRIVSIVSNTLQMASNFNCLTVNCIYYKTVNYKWPQISFVRLWFMILKLLMPGAVKWPKAKSSHDLEIYFSCISLVCFILFTYSFQALNHQFLEQREAYKESGNRNLIHKHMFYRGTGYPEVKETICLLFTII